MLVTHVEDIKRIFVVNVPETKIDKQRNYNIVDEMNSLKLIMWLFRPIDKVKV